MIQIERSYRGFKVTLREPGMGVRSQSVEAKSLLGVQKCIKHYFGENGHIGRQSSCPLCKLMREEGRR